jgi:DNA modification methylase
VASRILEGDCIEQMRQMDEASVDAIVTDPPYLIGFMGKEFDSQHRTFVERKSNRRAGSFEAEHGNHNPTDSADQVRTRRVEGQRAQSWHQAWATEALRVLKPGGHLLAFGGTRTYHRLACAVEDAGFEIRDSLIWFYGSGFPKSLDVSKAIDRQRDDYEARCAVAEWLRPHIEAHGFAEVSEHFGFKDQTMARARWTTRSQPNTPTLDQWAELKALLSLPSDMDAEVWRLNGRKGTPGENWEKREKVGDGKGAGSRGNTFPLAPEYELTTSATPEAAQWEGWGTALKPAHEPIVVARKPLSGTVAQTVLEHGTGALNIAATRIQASEGDREDYGPDGDETAGIGYERPAVGRWPANAVLSHLPECERVGVRKVKATTQSSIRYTALGRMNDDAWEPRSTERPAAVNADPDGTETVPAYNCAPGCPVAELDEQSGESLSAGGSAGNVGGYGWGENRSGIDPGYGDSGGASRFFYQAKSSRGERNAGLEGERSNHPTVKPIDLMRWLVRLVTPPGGTVLDPFAGSGTTGIACVLEGFDFIGIEREPEYAEIAKARIEWWSQFSGEATDAILIRAGLSERLKREHDDRGQLTMQPTLLDPGP